MCKKLTTKGRTKNNKSTIALCHVSDYGMESNRRNKKPWHERIRTLMQEFDFTKENGTDVYIDAIIYDTLNEAPKANDEEKYNIAHKKFKSLFKSMA